VNGNNIFDPGIDLPMSGVSVRLFQASQPITATPVSETVTGPNGTYTLYASASAAYYVHIPAAMFKIGAPLAGLRSVTGIGGTASNADTNKDDLIDENGLDNSNLPLDGVRSGNFTLSYGSMPLNTTGTQTFGENGYEAQMDDVADASGLMTIDFGFTVAPACPDITITPVALPSGSIGVSYSQALAATGGTAPYSYSLASGSLPDGLALASNGVISGTPSGGAPQTFTIIVTDTNGCQGISGSYTIATIVPLGTDFGDHAGFAFATQAANAAIRIGALPTDAETTNPANTTATGDDTVGSDDEDLTMPVFMSALPTTLSIPVTHVKVDLSGQTRINVFVDWNNDGDVADASETQAVQTVPANSSSVVNFVLTPPAATATSTAVTRYLRIRVTEGNSAPLFSGTSALKGEVEDYAITVMPPTDYSDHSAFGTASTVVGTTIRLGATVESELSATTNANATGDDTAGNDDEDGVTISTLTAGATATIPVIVTNSTGTSIYLNGWIDYNNNGQLTDPGEQIATNVIVTTGRNNFSQSLNITVPASATQGINLGARFLLTTSNNASPVGLSGVGEVEDYVVTIQAPPLTDFGDYTSFATASQTADPAVRIGSVAPDGEANSNLNTTATGDDLAGIDDEDVTMPSFSIGTATNLSFNVAITSPVTTAHVNVFVDWNGDGDVIDPSETQTAQPLTSSGMRIFTITPPANTIAGTKYLRIRMVEGATAPTFSGTSTLRGEVEDHSIIVTANAPPAAGPVVSNNLSQSGSRTFSGDPLADGDADGLTDLLEHALGTPATSGHHASRFTLARSSAGQLQAMLTRPVQPPDVRLTLETSTDLATWKMLTTAPRLTTNTDGTSTATYSGFDQNAAAGFIRLKVMLDADLNGTPEAVTTSAVHAWKYLDALPGRQSLSMPLLRPAIFCGAVQTVNQNTLVILNGASSIHTSLVAGEHYFVEVLSGPLAGQTLDIDTAETTGNTVTLTTTPDARLQGARIAIRPHHTLAGLIPASSLRGATESAAADRAMFFDTTTNAFRVLWVMDDGTSRKWLKEGDATLTDASARVIRPQEGMLIQIRDQATTLSLFGELRFTPEAPAAGTHFRGTGSVIPQAPSTLEVRPGSKLRLWSGDADPATGTYWNYQLDPAVQWIDERSGQNVSTQKLLQPFRAHFLTTAN
jgi:hypothetical protein